MTGHFLSFGGQGGTGRAREGGEGGGGKEDFNCYIEIHDSPLHILTLTSLLEVNWQPSFYSPYCIFCWRGLIPLSVPPENHVLPFPQNPLPGAISNDLA